MENQNNHTNKRLYAVVELFRKREKEFSGPEIEMAWRDCELRIRRRKFRRAISRVIASVSVSAAAAIALFIWWHGADLGGTIYSGGRHDVCDFALNNEVNVNGDHIVNIIPGRDTTEVSLRNAAIDCLANGSFVVNGVKVKSVSGKASQNDFCQLIVPKGHRAEITFADGTHLWANSNTRVVYPMEFKGETREIYVSGEIYIDVAPDKAHPFLVKNRDFNVEVLGTSFNVMAYDGRPSRVVLVSGKVGLSNASKEKVTMQPGQLVDIDGKTMSAPRSVDVTSYVSWKENMLIYSDKPLAEVFDRLNVCYGREFVLSPDVADIKVTGKLYLKEDIDAVLRSIEFSAPLRHEEKDGRIYVYHDTTAGK